MVKKKSQVAKKHRRKLTAEFGYRNFKRPFSLFLNVSDEPRAVKRSRVD